MANKTLFPSSVSGQSVPATDTTNRAGGRAHEFSPEHALAQLAATGTFNDTYYGTAVDQLEGIKELANKCSDEFVAKCAIYARQKGYMKDMPAALAVLLSQRNTQLLDQVFDRVIDNGKMVRNFVQLIRSGAFGRKSLGSAPKRLIKRWLNNQSDYSIFRASVGNSPSLVDVIKLVHPRPSTASRRALYGYLLGREHSAQDLPQIVKDFEAFKRGETTNVPNVDFRQLTALELSSTQWAEIARRGGWNQTKKNLNTYARHGVFDQPGLPQAIAAKLSDPEAIRKARVFPYELLIAYMAASGGIAGYNGVQADGAVPRVVLDALQDAMEVAIENIPEINGRVLVFPDISGSMGCPVTGNRKGATTMVTCRLVAALIASSFLRTNRDSLVLPFHNKVQPVRLNPRDSVITNAETLARLPSGGTSCSAPLKWCNDNNERGDLIVYVSDNESWVDSNGAQCGYGSRGTATMSEFQRFKMANPRAKMVCIDLSPRSTTQAPDAPNDIMNIGGFSDNVFETVARFVNGHTVEVADASTWTREIDSIAL